MQRLSTNGKSGSRKDNKCKPSPKQSSSKSSLTEVKRDTRTGRAPSPRCIEKPKEVKETIYGNRQTASTATSQSATAAARVAATATARVAATATAATAASRLAGPHHQYSPAGRLSRRTSQALIRSYPQKARFSKALASHRAQARSPGMSGEVHLIPRLTFRSLASSSTAPRTEAPRLRSAVCRQMSLWGQAFVLWRYATD
jgi:hypothetical protein